MGYHSRCGPSRGLGASVVALPEVMGKGCHLARRAMIHSQEGLLLTIEQLERMYRALADLHSRVAPLNYRNYQVFAEGPIDEILKLRREIDEYLGIPDNLPEPAPADPISAETARTP